MDALVKRFMDELERPKWEVIELGYPQKSCYKLKTKKRPRTVFLLVISCHSRKSANN